MSSPDKTIKTTERNNLFLTPKKPSKLSYDNDYSEEKQFKQIISTDNYLTIQ